MDPKNRTTDSKTARLMLALALLGLALIPFGCASYKPCCPGTRRVCNPAAGRNPLFIFDRASLKVPAPPISSEQFARAPWPTSSETWHYETTPEVTTYTESIYSNQYRSSSGVARDQHYQQLRGWRYGGSVR